jgi:hypothetical protein
MGQKGYRAYIWAKKRENIKYICVYILTATINQRDIVKETFPIFCKSFEGAT